MRDITPALQQLLAAHGITTQVEADGWLSTAGSYPACRAYINEPQFQNGGCTLRLDVEISLSAERGLIESFGDFGADVNEAFQALMQNFCSGSLHVLLGSLWGVIEPEQVFVEDYESQRQRWTLYLGNVVRKSAGGIDVPPPESLLAILKGLIEQSCLTPDIHWGRLYYANMPDGNNTVEVLLDNEPWESGQIAFRNAVWPKLSSFYSARMFWMLVPSGNIA
jgi:hypothetical protein